MAASMSKVLTFFKEGVFMLISKERIGLILERFSIVFPAPCPPDLQGELVNIYHKIFEGMIESRFDAAAATLLIRLKRFPYPSDFLDVLDRMPPKSATQPPDCVPPQSR